MATTTYVPIESKTLGSASATVDFTSIPQTYTDLVLVCNFGISVDGESSLFRVGNGTFDTGTNYSSTEVYGTGSVADSQATSSANGARVTYASAPNTSITNNVIINFQNYANTSTYKTTIARANVPTGTYPGTSATVSLWRSTSAINQIRLYLTGGNYLSGSTFTLYGIANANTGAKASGGVITYDSTYYYHTFGASGTFTPQQSLTADILVVAGGGGSGFDLGGGGGAGGLLTFASQSLTATGYTVTVGAGGGGGTSAGNGTNGGNSQFGALTASVGGGGGCGDANSAGNSGGSGGGAASALNKTGGSPTSGQGYAGGNSLTGGSYVQAANGGGGAGGIGGSQSNPSSPVGGNGGIGATSSLINAIGSATGTGQLVSGNYYYAGGGAGGTNASGTPGTGGYGGGANGAKGSSSPSNIGNNATANTGGGGGGGGINNGNGANGGSGVVIIRYLKA